MPTYHVQVSLCHTINDAGERGRPKARLREYDNRRGLGKDASVFSTRNNPIGLVQSVGTCCWCKAQRDLINGYCDVCRACGANNEQCTRSAEIML